jgi:hypothetical protein
VYCKKERKEESQNKGRNAHTHNQITLMKARTVDAGALKVDPDTGIINAVAWITRLAQAADSVRKSTSGNALDFLIVNPEVGPARARVILKKKFFFYYS